MFKRKILTLLTAFLCLLPAAAGARTINGNLDVSGGIVGALQTPGAYGLVLTLASGELKIQCTGDDPTTPADCSATNYGYVVAKGTTPGTFQAYKITSSPTFQDDAHASDSDFVGTGTCSWGTTAAVAWGNDLPYLIGFFHDGTDGYFVFTRGPVLDSGASTNIGYKDVCPSSASQNNVIAWTTSNVTSSHANQPITYLGSGRFQKSASDDWTFSALDNGDGIGNFYNFGIREYTAATGQMGASAGRFMRANGGTPPQWSSQELQFLIDMNGIVYEEVIFKFDGGTDGSGAVAAQIIVPYVQTGGGSEIRYGKGVFFVQWGGGSNLQFPTVGSLDNNASYFEIFRNTSSTTMTNLLNSDFSSGTREISGSMFYKAF